jgi:SH3-like domain-containing protein
MGGDHSRTARAPARAKVDGKRRMSSGSRALTVDARLLSIVAAAVIGATFPALAAQTGTADKLPRFASLRSDDINMRIGPGETYPIEWVYRRKDLPVEVIEQFQHWRRIEDWQGSKGWVLDRMLTDTRGVIVDGAVRSLYQRPDLAAPIVARAEPGVVARLLECRGAWCRIEAHGYSGWVESSEVWGVLPNESLP